MPGGGSRDQANLASHGSIRVDHQAKTPRSGAAGVDLQRPADGVADLRGRVDPEGVEDGRAEVVGADRVAGRVGGPAVGCAVDDAAGDAAAGQDGRVAARPVLAARVPLGDPRGAAELADPDDSVSSSRPRASRSSSRAAKPRSAGGIRRFFSWLKLSPWVSQKFWPSLCQLTVTSADARLDQPPRQQERLAVDVPAVAVADLRVFALDLERAPGLGRDEGIERLRLESRPRMPADAPERPAGSRKARARRGDRPSARGVSPSGRPSPLDLEARRVRVALDPRTGRTPCRASRRAGRVPCRPGRPGA